MILLCCKEINVNKPKNKMSTRSLVTKDGKPKLQLKGRIFMQNVTETISLQKPGRTATARNNIGIADIHRLVHLPNLLERRPWNRELHHPLHLGRNYEKMGHASGYPTTSMEGPGASQFQHYSLEAFRYPVRLHARSGPGKPLPRRRRRGRRRGG
jgi:hypothetical protein